MMSSHPTTLLVLGLCLGWTVHMQEGSLPKPSISTEPRERGVIVVCQSTVDVDRFRLERGGELVMDETSNPSTKKEARFYLNTTTESTAGCYQCLSGLGNDWSLRSKCLELKMTSENIAPGSAVPSDTPGLKTDHIYTLIGVSVFIILCLLSALSLCMYRRHQGKQELLSGKGQRQRPQESPSPAADGMERTPDITEDDRLPEKDRGTDVSAPVVGDLQEVTYAQLDHGALTQSTGRVLSPHSAETTAESSTYAAIIIR